MTSLVSMYPKAKLYLESRFLLQLVWSFYSYTTLNVFASRQLVETEALKEDASGLVNMRLHWACMNSGPWQECPYN